MKKLTCSDWVEIFYTALMILFVGLDTLALWFLINGVNSSSILRTILLYVIPILGILFILTIIIRLCIKNCKIHENPKQINIGKELNSQKEQQTTQDQLDRIENLLTKLHSDGWVIAVMSASVTAVIVAGSGIAYTYSSRIWLFIIGVLGFLIAVLRSRIQTLLKRIFKRKKGNT